MKSSEVGQMGESLACEFLKKKKYRIIERNYRRSWGELDIVAYAPDGTLVFVEVKTLLHRSDMLELGPEDNLTSNKLNTLKRTCEKYALNHPRRINEKKGWRIDAVTLTSLDKSCLINHYENI